MKGKIVLVFVGLCIAALTGCDQPVKEPRNRMELIDKDVLKQTGQQKNGYGRAADADKKALEIAGGQEKKVKGPGKER